MIDKLVMVNSQSSKMVSRIALWLLVMVSLSACDSVFEIGGSSTTPFEGAGVKGPLVNALVVAYELDPSRRDLKGAQLETGFTDDAAKLQMNLRAENGSKGPFLIEYQGGTELSGEVPVIDRLQTIMTRDELKSGKPVFATPLSSLALQIAAQGNFRSSQVQPFLNSLDDAEQTVKTIFGLSGRNELDLFTSSPLLNDGGNVENTFVLRRANEIFAAIVSRISQELNSDGVPQTGATLVTILAADAADGMLDGLQQQQVISELSSIDNFESMLSIESSVTIPGTNFTFADLDQMLLTEATTLQLDVSFSTAEMLAVVAATPSNIVSVNDEESDTGGSDTGGSDTGGSDTGGTDTGGSDTGGTDTGGTDTGGTDTGGTDTGGTDTESSEPLVISLSTGTNAIVASEGDDLAIDVIVDEVNRDNTQCAMNVFDENNVQIGSSEFENNAPFNFYFSAVGQLAVGEYSVRFQCLTEQGQTASLETTLIIEGSNRSTIADVEFSWVWPTTREDGSPLAVNELSSMEIYYFPSGQSGAGTLRSVPARDADNNLVNTVVIEDLIGEESYDFSIAFVDTNGRVSEFSNTATILIQ